MRVGDRRERVYRGVGLDFRGGRRGLGEDGGETV